MKIGLFGINFGPAADPDAMTRIARAAEDAGLDSVWTGEHVVLPDPRVPPSPADPDMAFLDPAVALGHVAATTSRILLGTGIIILPQRNPLVLAKELATVDVVSKGRLVFGLGAGYLEPEFRAIGAPFEERGKVTDEAIDAIVALWTMEKPAFTGRYFSFEGIQAMPRPVRKPHPPIVVGGMTRGGALRAARKGNGWYGFLTNVDATRQSIAWIREETGRGGRPDRLGEIEISVTPPPPVDADAVRRYEDAGVHRLIALPLGQDVKSILATVDELGRLAG